MNLSIFFVSHLHTKGEAPSKLNIKSQGGGTKAKKAIAGKIATSGMGKGMVKTLINVCICMYMYVYMYVCMYLCIYVCMYEYICVCMYIVCIYIYIFEKIYKPQRKKY